MARLEEEEEAEAISNFDLLLRSHASFLCFHTAEEPKPARPAKRSRGGLMARLEEEEEAEEESWEQPDDEIW